MQVRKKKITRFRECCTHSKSPLLSLAWGAIHVGSKKRFGLNSVKNKYYEKKHQKNQRNDAPFRS
jgi:hypothetical protein